MFAPPSAFIHGDLWGSFIALDIGDLELSQHMSKSLSQLMVTQAKPLELCQQMNMHIFTKLYGLFNA